MTGTLLGKRVYLDASALIYATEMPHLYPALGSGFVAPLSAGALTAVTSWITLSETLIRPLKLNDIVLAGVYRNFLRPSASLEIYEVGDAVAEGAGRLRASHGFKLPDAIHIATGIAAGCDVFLTGDAQWARAGVRVIEPANL